MKYKINILAEMLYITIVTLLIASNDISRIQAQEEGEQRAQLNGPRWLGINLMKSADRNYREQPFQNQKPDKGSELGPVAFQNGKTINIPPGNPTVIGMYLEQTMDGHRFVGSEAQNGDVLYVPTLVQNNNKFITQKDGKNAFGWPRHQLDYVSPDTNAQTEKKAQNNKNSQAQTANSSHLQLGLSFEKFYVYTLMLLCKYHLF